MKKNYKKKVTVEATAYTDHSGNRCSTGVMPQTGYIAVNPNLVDIIEDRVNEYINDFDKYDEWNEAHGIMED